jgi:hypothetical protein
LNGGHGETDPVLVRRGRIATAVSWGQRVGYGCFALAVVLFVVGAATGFPAWSTATITGLLVVGSLVLAPAIVFHYGLRAAEREDRDAGRDDHGAP